MTIDFYNKDVPNAQFKICWGISQCTPIFTLKPGGMGSYDLNYSHIIPQGAQCYVYAWSGTIDKNDSALVFVYEKGKTDNLTFNYSIDSKTHQLSLQLEMAA